VYCISVLYSLIVILLDASANIRMCPLASDSKLKILYLMYWNLMISCMRERSIDLRTSLYVKIELLYIAKLKVKLFAQYLAKGKAS